MNHEEASSEEDQEVSSHQTAETAPPKGGGEASTTVRILAVIAVLAVGVLITGALVSFRRPPAEAKVVERTLSVEATTVVHEDVAVVVTGLGKSVH